MWTRRGLVVAIAVGVFAALLIQIGALALAERPLVDLFQRTARGSAPDPPSEVPDVALVTIDARSLRAFGNDWPWPGSRYAEIVRRLGSAGASAIAFDVDFAGSPDGVETLSLAMTESGRVVLGGFAPEGGAPDELRLPNPLLRKSAGAIGFAGIQADGDGVVRSMVVAREFAHRRVPSLAAAAFSIGLGEPPVIESLDPIWIDFRRDAPPVPRISSIDVLEGRFDPREVAGRVVFVGPTVETSRALVATPLGPGRPTVWLQAMAMRTLAARRADQATLREVHPLLAGLGVILLSLGVGAIRPASRLLREGTLVGAAMLCPIAALVLHQAAGLVWHPVVPVLVLAAHFVLGLPSIRRRLGDTMEESELSLAELFDLHGSRQSSDVGPLELALAHLADVVSASGVALFRSEPNGELDPIGLDWRRSGRRRVGDQHTAALALADRQTRVFRCGVPGTDLREGEAIYSPLFAGAVPVGVLVVERPPGPALDDTQLRTIATVGAQLALSIRNARLYQELQDTFEAAVGALAATIEARDGFTESHSQRLSILAALMAERLGLSGEEIEAIRLGALLHDIGKLGLRDDVLLKRDRLTPEERRHVEDHPDIGYRALCDVPGLSRTTLGCVRHHHERWNGTGYPDGLAGEEIPIGARILSVIDVWDALSSPRPYKSAFPQAHVREILRKDSGARFEPALVDLFLEVLDEVGSDFITGRSDPGGLPG